MNFVALMGSSWPSSDTEKPISDFMSMDEMIARVREIWIHSTQTDLLNRQA